MGKLIFGLLMKSVIFCNEGIPGASIQDKFHGVFSRYICSMYLEMFSDISAGSPFIVPARSIRSFFDACFFGELTFSSTASLMTAAKDTFRAEACCLTR